MLKLISVNILAGIIMLCLALCIRPGCPSASTYLDCKAFCCRVTAEYMALLVGTRCTKVMNEHNRGPFSFCKGAFMRRWVSRRASSLLADSSKLSGGLIRWKRKQQWHRASPDLTDAFQIVLEKLMHWYHERHNRVMLVTSERLTWQITWFQYLTTIQIFNGNPICSA